MLPLTFAVSVTEHLPAMSVQVFEENVTPPVPDTFDQVTFPVRGVYPPVTIAVQVILVPTAKVDLVQVMIVWVGGVVAFRTVIRSHGLVAEDLVYDPKARKGVKAYHVVVQPVSGRRPTSPSLLFLAHVVSGRWNQEIFESSATRA